jgi:hypothetical protein
MQCTLTPEERSTRGKRWLALDQADVEETWNGLRLGFPASAEAELRDLARLEGECCAFASWDVTRDGDRAILELTAEGEAVTAVQSMFASLRK